MNIYEGISSGLRAGLVATIQSDFPNVTKSTPAMRQITAQYIVSRLP